MEVFTIRTLVTRNGEIAGFYNMDMVILEGKPHAVFEWAAGAEGKPIPTAIVELDPVLMHQLPGGEGEDEKPSFQYQAFVEDPRPEA